MRVLSAFIAAAVVCSGGCASQPVRVAKDVQAPMTSIPDCDRDGPSQSNCEGPRGIFVARGHEEFGTTKQGRPYCKIDGCDCHGRHIRIIAGNLGTDGVRAPRFKIEDASPLRLCWHSADKEYALLGGFARVEILPPDPASPASSPGKTLTLWAWSILVSDSVATGAESTKYDFVVFGDESHGEYLGRGKIYWIDHPAKYGNLDQCGSLQVCAEGEVHSVDTNHRWKELSKQKGDYEFQTDVENFVQEVLATHP